MDTDASEYSEVVVEAVRDAYALEEQAVEDFYERSCETTWFDIAVGFVPYVGDMLSPTCLSPDPPGFEKGSGYVEQRMNAVIARIEGAVGYALDDETKANIREDVRAIWYGGL